MTDINKMTRKEFEALPFREDWCKEIICDSIILLPQRTLHDSGYRHLDFVAVRDNEPVCKLSGRSDVIHLDGIGGFGYNWSKGGHVPDIISVSGWNMDCLPKSGLLRLFCNNKHILCGAALSSFEVYAVKGG